MEVLRCVAFGRVSEMVGPVGLDLDHTLRIFDFGRAVPEIERQLPEETRDWLSGFVSGINHCLLRTDAALPHEFALFVPCRVYITGRQRLGMDRQRSASRPVPPVQLADRRLSIAEPSCCWFDDPWHAIHRGRAELSSLPTIGRRVTSLSGDYFLFPAVGTE